MDKLYDELAKPDEMFKKQIKSVLVNDIEFAKLAGYINSPPLIVYRDWKRGKLHERTRNPSTLGQLKPSVILQEFGTHNGKQ